MSTVHVTCGFQLAKFVHSNIFMWKQHTFSPLSLSSLFRTDFPNNSSRIGMCSDHRRGRQRILNWSTQNVSVAVNVYKHPQIPYTCSGRDRSFRAFEITLLEGGCGTVGTLWKTERYKVRVATSLKRYTRLVLVTNTGSGIRLSGFKSLTAVSRPGHWILMFFVKASSWCPKEGSCAMSHPSLCINWAWYRCLINAFAFLCKNMINKEPRFQKQITKKVQIHTLLMHLVATARQILPAHHCLPTAGNSGHENDVVCLNHSCLLVTEQGGSLNEQKLCFFCCCCFCKKKCTF